MSSSIYKYYVNVAAVGNVTKLDSISLDTINSDILFISHTIDAVKSNTYSLPFTITVSKLPAPYINEEEMVVVVREKVDFAASGPNYTTIKNIGKDIGKEDYTDYVPLRQSDLPNGFVELKGINEHK